jgi:hypothetical protein
MLCSARNILWISRLICALLAVVGCTVSVNLSREDDAIMRNFFVEAQQAISKEHAEPTALFGELKQQREGIAHQKQIFGTIATASFLLILVLIGIEGFISWKNGQRSANVQITPSQKGTEPRS